MQRRKLHDQYFKKAKAEGYLARSAYKLQEIQERKGIIAPGARVLDLGCAPGAWLQVASEIAGPAGTVVGIDLIETRHQFESNVRAIQGDAYEVEPAELTALAGGHFDTVLSDMAPNTSGSGDDLLSARLCRRVIELLPALLRPGGNLAMKIFEGAEYNAVLTEARQMFREARGFKPKASREMSREMYIIAIGFRGD